MPVRVNNGPTATVRVMAYKVIKEQGFQFRCFACHQITQQEQLTKLQDEVARLTSLVSDLQSKPSHDAPVSAVPGSYATAVTVGELGDHSSKLAKPPRTDSYESNRKFNVVMFGIGECRQGANRSERLAHDLSKVESVLTDIDGFLKSSSIKDCFRLGKYRADQAKPRPILVKFVRIEDVSKVLSNRWAVKSPIAVKPDMTRDGRVRESTLLKHRSVPPTSRIHPYFYENLVRITGKNLRIRKRNSAPGGVASITTNGEHARSTDYVR